MKMRNGTSSRNVVNQLSSDEGTRAKGTGAQLHGDRSYMESSVTR